jgi:prepilin-type processing-associated H-X9-DG protein
MAAVALTAFLLWVVSQFSEGREAACRAQCVNNLKQIGLALHNYASVHDAFPAGTVNSPKLPPADRLSWFLLILEFLEQTRSRLLIDPGEPWNAGANRILIVETIHEDQSISRAPMGEISAFQCPSHRHPATPPGRPSATDYVGIAGLGTDAATLPAGHRRAGFFGYARQTRIEDITDGTTHTMMLAETAFANGPWTAGGPATVRGLDPARQPYLGRGRQFGGSHPAGANILLADGSVRFVPETVDPRTFEALSTIAGREPLGSEW